MAIAAAIPLITAAASAAYQGGKGLSQRRAAKKLKESKFVPKELLMNKDLAMEQAYSRRAPGQSQAEENIRRNSANAISAASRMYGGDANKVAAVAAAVNGQANDANRGLAANGAQFSEQAFNRLSGANNAIASQKRQNNDEFNQAKAALIASGDQNIYNSINNLSTLGLSAMSQGTGKGARFAQGQMQIQSPWLNYGNNEQLNSTGQFDPYGSTYGTPASKWAQRRQIQSQVY